MQHAVVDLSPGQTFKNKLVPLHRKYDKTLLKLFGFPTFRFWAYLMKVIPEARRVH